MLMHLAANAIPLGLWITGQEVPQLLVHLGNCLVVLFLGFLEHLLGLLDLQLAGLHVIVGRDSFLQSSSLQEILEHLGQLHNSLPELPALCIQPVIF